MHEQRGYTLLELLVTLSLTALLATLSAPVFSDLAMKARLDAATDRLHEAIRHTRSAAVARGAPVVMRATSDGWERGWTVFVDDDADGHYQSGEYRLRAANPLPTSITVTANAGIGEALHYQADGGTRRPSGSLQMGTLHVCQRGAAGMIRASRSIIINASGRPRIEQPDPSADGSGC